MDFLTFTLFLVISFIGQVLGDELCYDIRDGYFYCEYGCCGDTFDEYCCGVYSWIIAVAVIGFIIVVAVIVIVICVVKKNKGRTGRIIQPTGQAQVHTIQTVHVPPPGYNQQPQYMNMQPYPNQPPPQYPPPQDAVYPPPPPPNY